MRVYLLSPAYHATGGTELLHQFSKCLSDNGIENFMIYPDADKIHCPTPPTFMKYGVRYVSQYIDAPDSILVLAETQIHLVKECQKGTAMIWWLSVNNYVEAYKEQLTDNNYDIFGLSNRQNVVHFVQSYYAKDFVHTYFNTDNCYFLMDYINDDIVNWALTHKDTYQRQNICVFNPKKGYPTLEPIIKACRKDITWLPLLHMTPTEMADAMCKAKLYVDFGAHPGKDRIPREAAVCDCCVLTNRQGSAAYEKDVNIPEQYKINDTKDINAVLEIIYDLIDNYDDRTKEYLPYRQQILQEKDDFMRDVRITIAILQKIAISKTPVAYPNELTEHIKTLNSISAASNMINELSQAAQADCLAGDVSQLMNDLLTTDYILQIIRENLYKKLADISNT